MSEEQDKLNFFKSLKKTIFNSEPELKNVEEVVENKIELPEEPEPVSSIGVMTTKAVIPKETIEPVAEYKSISSSNFLDERFAENFVYSGGKFVYCQNEKEFFHYLKSLKEENEWNHVFSWNNALLDFLSYNDFQREEISFSLAESDAGISYCFNLSANDGVVILSPEQATNRRLVTFPKTHIIIAYKNQLKDNIDGAIENFDKQFGGRLASILELHKGKPVTKANHKTLLSADGPKDVYLFYIDSDELG